jgi:hypothetical protein
MTWARLWRWFQRRPPAASVRHQPDGEGGRRAVARARFWAELREGQREAEVLKVASLIPPRVPKG